MNRTRLLFAWFCAIAVLLCVAALPAAAQGSKFVGTWQLSMTGGSRGGGEAGGDRGGGAQSLTITQDGDKFKVTHTTPRGENTSDATVSGNTISWTEVRQRRDGSTMNIDFKATLDGDTLTGTMGGGQFSREFTAKRSN